MEVVGRNLSVRFVGPDDENPAGIRADTHIPEDCLVYYYEVCIISLGSGGKIGIGYGVKTAHLGEMVGWGPDSFGIHADDVRTYSNSTVGSKFPKSIVAPFVEGDVVGCGLDFLKQEVGCRQSIPLLSQLLTVWEFSASSPSTASMWGS